MIEEISNNESGEEDSSESGFSTASFLSGGLSARSNPEIEATLARINREDALAQQSQNPELKTENTSSQDKPNIDQYGKAFNQISAFLQKYHNDISQPKVEDFTAYLEGQKLSDKEFNHAISIFRELQNNFNNLPDIIHGA